VAAGPDRDDDWTDVERLVGFWHEQELRDEDDKLMWLDDWAREHVLKKLDVVALLRVIVQPYRSPDRRYLPPGVPDAMRYLDELDRA
jgi:hypothetical protein